jgi:hypothetical protein
LDTVWSEYEASIKSGKINPPPEPLFEGDTAHGRVLNPHITIEPIKQILFDQKMVEIVSLLLGVRALPFQTIIGHKGSEQLQHSDSIHMSTYPSGYLVANWIAFEDIKANSGPLVYHPGSHKLPFLTAEELSIDFDIGYEAYHDIYEPAIQNIITKYGFETHCFLATK